MTRNRLIAAVLAAAATALAFNACTVASTTRLGPQSHFVYPNSNVKQLGPVRVKKWGPMRLFLADNLRTARVDRDLYEEALRQVQGANVVTDYVVTSKTIVLPLYYVHLFWNFYELEGTAARMEVGRQHLR